MTEEELKGLLDNYIDDSQNAYRDTDNEIQKAVSYYLGKPFGNEVTGKSSVVDRSVASAIDGALPQLLKIFTQSVDVVEFTPQSDGDAAVAEDVTQYVNHIFNKDNDGAILMHNWFWDALVNKVGIISARWDDAEEQITEEYQGLSEDELTMLTNDEGIKILEQEELVQPTYANNEEGRPELDENGQAIVQESVVMYNVKVEKTTSKGRVKIENVSTAEFMIDRHADCIKDARFVAQRKMLTRSELVAMGFDKDIVAELTTDDEIGLNIEGLQFNPVNEVNNVDPSQELIALYECYIDIGEEDGMAKKHRICYASKQILSDEEIDYVPFYSICPFPVPHTFYGQSMADRTMELQFIKSVSYTHLTLPTNREV